MANPTTVSALDSRVFNVLRLSDCDDVFMMKKGCFYMTRRARRVERSLLLEAKAQPTAPAARLAARAASAA